jgi:SAM-dependent methyltransferase
MGQPVLIDFDNSVCEPESYAVLKGGSVLQRDRSGVRKRISQIVWGKNERAQQNARKFLQRLFVQSDHPTILIVGGGTIGAGSEDLYQHPNVQLISFDIYASQYTDFVADAHQIPLKDASVDGVWIQAVLEHVLDPAQVVREMHRVLKSDGIIYAETPFMQQVHEKAYDYTRFTESGHRWLFREFELIDSGSVLGLGTSLVWSIRYFTSALFRSKKVGMLFAILFFWLRLFDHLMPSDYTSDGASSLFFMGQKSARSLPMAQIVGFYRGVNDER